MEFDQDGVDNLWFLDCEACQDTLGVLAPYYHQTREPVGVEVQLALWLVMRPQRHPSTNLVWYGPRRRPPRHHPVPQWRGMLGSLGKWALPMQARRAWVECRCGTGQIVDRSELTLDVRQAQRL